MCICLPSLRGYLMKPPPVSPHALRQIYSSSDGILMTLILVALVFFPPLQISFVHPSLLGLPKEPLERHHFQTTINKLMHLVLPTPVRCACFALPAGDARPGQPAGLLWIRKDWQVNQVSHESAGLCRAWRGLEELPEGGSECRFLREIRSNIG